MIPVLGLLLELTALFAPNLPRQCIVSYAAHGLGRGGGWFAAYMVRGGERKELVIAEEEGRRCLGRKGGVRFTEVVSSGAESAGHDC